MKCSICDYELSPDELKQAAKEVARQYGLKGARLRYGKKEFIRKRAPRVEVPTYRRDRKSIMEILKQCGLEGHDGGVKHGR